MVISDIVEEERDMDGPLRFLACFGYYQVSSALQTNQSTLHSHPRRLSPSHNHRQVVVHRYHLALVVKWLLWVQA